MKLNGDDVIVLIGAGASCDAGLLSSAQMLKELENKVNTAPGWKEFKTLYYCVKSSILYGYGIKGKNNTDELNIEQLVCVLDELARCGDHTIYPFIAAWNMELVKYGGNNFEKITALKKKIIEELVSRWVHLSDDSKAHYYQSFCKLGKSISTSLKIFSLNYDLCVERTCRDNVHRGFRPDRSGTKIWDDRNLENRDQITELITLYKLHGSLDWRRDEKKELYCEDDPHPCDNVDDYQLIFGTNYKLRYDDPFLYLASSLRRYAIEAKIVVCIGYSFNDSHINAILARAFRRNSTKRLIVVTMSTDKTLPENFKRDISEKTEVDVNQISLYTKGAKDFMENDLKLSLLESLCPEVETPF